MKFVINPIFRTILIVGSWFFCIRKTLLEFNHTHFFDISLPLLIFLAVVISCCSFLVDFGCYKASGKVFNFTPAFISVLCIGTLIVTNQYLKRQDKSPTLFYAYSGVLDKISFDFRENGTYKCTNGIIFGDLYYMRGKYSIKDSVILLDKSNLFDLIKTNRLQMNTFPKKKKPHKRGLFALLLGLPKADTLPETFLFQVDNKGDKIPSAIVLHMNNDVIRYR